MSLSEPIWLAVAGAAGVLALILYFQIIRPWGNLAETLRRLAAKDFRPVILPRAPWLFRRASRDLRAVTELLQQFDRQIADEGFSLKAILSSMVEGVLITDRSQRVRLVNDALIGLFGLKLSPVNRSVMEVFRKHELQQSVDVVLSNGRPQRIELTFETAVPSGYDVRHFAVHVAGINPKPGTLPTAALLVFHDVTKVRNLEAMRREFLANVSHEFRTPLAIINGYVETLLDGALDDADMARRSLQSMHRNGQRLSLLIDDLLTISRIEDRAKLMEFQPDDLRERLTHVLEHLDPNIRERHAVIEIDWADDARRAEIDGVRMEQVYSNLLGNSLRYGDPHGLVIRIRARRHGEEIRIAFTDNGPGIPYDDQPHIFERFYRVHKDRSRDAGGTGLGLSIVRSVVEAHGGTVSVESTPGEGATFRIRIPVVQPGGAQPNLL
ncbi:MAG: ATP-binding protein [Terrimicrobiaceae bacterium]|nr:ATP-binding protein [Terrimicrobiaceae bacterium]